MIKLGWIIMLLSPLLVALWIRSYWMRDWLGVMNTYVMSESGGFCIVSQFPPPQRFGSYANRRITKPREYVDQELSRAGASVLFAKAMIGFDASTVQRYPGLTGSGPAVFSLRLILPYWFIVPIVFTLGWTSRQIGLRRRIRRLRAKGLCVNCEYDLHGSSERCPECGTSVRPAPRLSA